jgi:hypothetical protein
VVGAAQARCEIGIDNGRLFSYYFPAAGADTDPAELCGMVLRILGVDAGESAGQYAYLHRGATLKGAVAREVQARGLDADLAVYEDDVFYDMVAEVILANPAKPECGAVRVTDDGTILWECDYRGLPERGGSGRRYRRRHPLPSPRPGAGSNGGPGRRRDHAGDRPERVQG